MMIVMGKRLVHIRQGTYAHHDAVKHEGAILFRHVEGAFVGDDDGGGVRNGRCHHRLGRWSSPTKGLGGRGAPTEVLGLLGGRGGERRCGHRCSFIVDGIVWRHANGKRASSALQLSERVLIALFQKLRAAEF